MKGQQKQEHTGRRKGAKGKQAQDRCYRCGQQGHIAREAPTATTEQHDATYQSYEDPRGYDNNYAQPRMMRSSSTDINGFTCTMLKDNQSSYHFTCVTYNNPLYPYQGLKNKVLNTRSKKDNQQ